MVEALTHTPFSSDVQVYMHREEGAEGDLLLEVHAAKSCTQIIPNGPEVNGWQPARLASPLPATDLARDVVWNNLGEATVDAVLLVAPGVPCVPGVFGVCHGDIDGRRITRWPKYIGEEGDVIRVSVVQAPEGKIVARTVVYIDHREAYRTVALQPVDLRYMRAGDHVVEVQVTYTDGTVDMYQEMVHNPSESLTNYFYVYVRPHTQVLVTGLAAVAGICLGTFLLAVCRTWYRRRLWLKEHNLLR